eukprot:scaffold21225_cov55-Phaeocystis_antarctica.AAC.3
MPKDWARLKFRALLRATAQEVHTTVRLLLLRTAKATARVSVTVGAGLFSEENALNYTPLWSKEH